MDLLRRIKIADVNPGQPLLVLNADDTVNHAFQTLVRNNIMSAPVVYTQPDGSKLTKIVDLADILRLITDMFHTDERFLEADINVILKRSGSESPRTKSLSTIGSIAGLSTRSAAPIVSEGANLAEVSNALAAGFHRVLVVNKSGQPINIITQSTVMNLIFEHKSHLGTLLKTSVFDVKLGAKEVQTISETLPVIDAFRLLLDKGISAVPVVDKDGEVVGVISTKDVKVVCKTAEKTIKRLYMTCQEFVKTKEVEHEGPRAVVACKVNDTFETVLSKLHRNLVHRVFVVNELWQPIGVISFQDVLQLLLDWDVATNKKLLKAKIEQHRHPTPIGAI